jgi:hypothetical protein
VWWLEGWQCSGRTAAAFRCEILAA